LADVTGHGEAVAATATALRDLMRRNVNVIGQSKLVATLNDEFAHAESSGRFATAVVMTHFSPRQELAVSIAGHPPPLYYCAAEQRWSLLTESESSGQSKTHNLPLGVIEAADYSSTRVHFAPGDCLLAYTDALSEACDDSGTMLHPAGLLREINALGVSSPADVIPSLVARLRGLSASNLSSDDATAVLLTPANRRIPLKQNLLAPWRMLNGVSEQASVPSQQDLSRDSNRPVGSSDA
jgi:serine phosphatase RsbU (regulator of sigma subunit)